MVRTAALFMIWICMCGCESIDFTGLVTAPGDNTDKRFAQSIEYMESQGVKNIRVEDSYVFYVCTDVHVNRTAVNLGIFMDSLRNDPDAAFALMLGDCIDARGMMPVFADALTYRPQTQQYDHPIFVTLGNHDTFYSQWDDFRDIFGASAYYFEVEHGSGKDLFISLDSASGTLGSKQAQWLRKLFAEKRSSYDKCIVFTHTNFFKTDNSQTASGNFPLEETMALSELFDRYDVDLVLQGHDHYREDLTFRAVRYLTVGCIKDGFRAPEYLKVTVREASLSYDWVYL